MNPHLLPEPERWSERAGGTSAEDAIGASLKRIRAATEPSTASSARWAHHAMTPIGRRPGLRVGSTAIVATLLLGGAAAAGVAWHARVTGTAAHTTGEDPAPAARARVSPRRHVAPPVPVEQAPLPDPVPDPELEAAALPPAPPLATRKLARATTIARAATQPTPMEPPPLAPDPTDEASLVARAFRHLRNEGDARGALAALDERERRFGDGALGSEAALARAEALLLLGRTEEALPILAGIQDPRAGLTSEVRATRAELLARSRRCAEAEEDFAALLAPGAPRATRERALYARASCRLQAARPDDAAVDLERYLTEFPGGRSAAAARAALARLHRP